MTSDPDYQEARAQTEQQPMRPVSRTLRDCAVAALDVADRVADWVREAIGRMPEWEVVEGEGEEEEEETGGEAGEGESPATPHEAP